VIVRQAVAGDGAAIVAGALVAFADHPSKPDIGRLLRALAGATDEGLVLVADSRGRGVVGSLALQRGLWEHSGEAFLRDRWLYTLPGAGDRAMPALLEAARAIAGKLELPLYLGASSTRLEAIVRRFRGLGGELATVSFRW
jgi:hypothetical protein